MLDYPLELLLIMSMFMAIDIGMEILRFGAYGKVLLGIRVVNPR